MFSTQPVQGESFGLSSCHSTLTLILELCRQFSPDSWLMDADSFGSAVYFGKVTDGKSVKEILGAIQEQLPTFARADQGKSTTTGGR